MIAARAGLPAGWAFALVLVLAPAPAPAQETEEAAAEPAAEPSSTGLPFDDLLGEDELLRPQGYVYDSGGRRDPFRSLAATRARGPRDLGPRPEGIPGLLIDEIDVTGIFVLADGPVAQIRSTQQEQSYLLRVGDQLFDGDVIAITGSEIVFKQIVDDPTAIKPFREVAKGIEIEEGPQ